MAELKPCPFCKSEDVYLVSETEIEYNWVYCKNCEAAGPMKETEEEAIEAWNRRAGEE